jgi:hypothetical protein
VRGGRVVWRVMQGDEIQATFTYEADAREYLVESNIGAPDPFFTLRRVRIRPKARTSEGAVTAASAPSLPGGGSEEGPAPISAEAIEREAERLFLLFQNTPPCSPVEWHQTSYGQQAGWTAVAKDKLEAEAKRNLEAALRSRDECYRRITQLENELAAERAWTNAVVCQVCGFRWNRLDSESCLQCELAAERATRERLEGELREYSSRWDAQSAEFLEREGGPAPVSPPAWTPKQRALLDAAQQVRRSLPAYRRAWTEGEIALVRALDGLDAGKDEGGR